MSENIQALNTQLKSVTTERNCIKNQLSTKDEVEKKLRKEIEYFQSQTSSLSLESEIANLKKLQALEIKTIRVRGVLFFTYFKTFLKLI